MNNVILKSLAVENYASFADRIMFTTEIDSSKKEYLENTFEIADKRFNKVSILYGANGSGKTFFCKILREVKRLLDWSPLMAMNNSQLLSLPQFKGMDAPVKPFVFDMHIKINQQNLRLTLSLIGLHTTMNLIF